MVAERAFGFFGTNIAVTSDEPAVLDWLDEFLTPAFEPVARDACDFGVAVWTDGARYDAMAALRPSGALDEAPCSALDREVKHHPCWTSGGRLVIADEKLGAFYVLTTEPLHFPHARVEVLTSPGSLRFRTGTMRVIREIAVARALADPRRLMMHAAGTRSRVRSWRSPVQRRSARRPSSRTSPPRPVPVS